MVQTYSVSLACMVGYVAAALACMLWYAEAATITNTAPCCTKKTVGGTAYSLVNTTDTDTSGYNCLNNCVYQKDGYIGSRFCFAKGNLAVICGGDEVEDVSDFCIGSTCASCCCIGPCAFGACIGICTLKDQSLDEACVMNANKLSNEDCSADCADQGGSQACQSCLVAKNPEACSNTASTSCWSCLVTVGKAALKCYTTPQDNTTQTDWKKVLECVILDIPSSCASCACELLCNIFPPVCNLCETTTTNSTLTEDNVNICKAEKRFEECLIIERKCQPGFTASATLPTCDCTCIKG